MIGDPIKMKSIFKRCSAVNYGANNIVRWKLGGDHWTLLTGSIQGICGSTSTSLCLPTYLTLELMKKQLADRENQRIQLLLNGQSNGTMILIQALFLKIKQ